MSSLRPTVPRGCRQWASAPAHRPMPLPAARSGRRWAASPFRTAALQLLQLPGTFVMVRQGQLTARNRRIDGRPRDVSSARSRRVGEGRGHHDRERDRDRARRNRRPRRGRCLPDDIEQDGIHLDLGRPRLRKLRPGMSSNSARPGHRRFRGAGRGSRAAVVGVADLPGVRLEFVRAASLAGYNERPIARSHRLRSEEPRGILQEARGRRHQTGSAIHAVAEFCDGDCLPHGSVGHVHRAH